MRTMADKEKRQPVPAGEIKPVKDSSGRISTACKSTVHSI